MPTGSSEVLGLLWQSTLQASSLAVLVLILQAALRRKLSAGWFYMLWLPVVLRMLLPVVPESSWSMFNLGKLLPPPAKENLMVHPHEIAQVSLSTFVNPPANQATMSQPLQIESGKNVRGQRGEPQSISWVSILLIGWMTGLLMLMVWTLANYLRFKRSSRQFTVVVDSDVDLLFAECRQTMGCTRSVKLLEGPHIDSPALSGCFRPKLLLPQDVWRKFDRNELRHVFMHELAHVQRWDLAANWLLTAAQFVHWFNPLLWFALNRVRADRELACDESVLSRLGASEAASYGQTVIKLLEKLAPSGLRPGVLGFSQGRREMERRIRRIASFNLQPRHRWLPVSLLAIVCATGLSDAQPVVEKEQGTFQDNLADAVVTTNQFTFNVPPDQARINEQSQRLRPSPPRARIYEKLSTIRLKEFRIAPDLPLSEVIKLLNASIKEQGPTKLGLNFIIASSESAQVQDYRVSLPVPIENAPLKEILQKIVDGAKPPLESSLRVPLRFTVEDYAVVFSQRQMEQFMVRRTYRLDPARFYAELKTRTGIAIDQIADIQANPAWEASWSKTVREYFLAAGVNFPANRLHASRHAYWKSVTLKPETKAILLNEQTGILQVRAPLRDVELIERAIPALSLQPPRFRFDATIMSFASNSVSTRMLLSQIPQKTQESDPQDPALRGEFLVSSEGVVGGANDLAAAFAGTIDPGQLSPLVAKLDRLALTTSRISTRSGVTNREQIRLWAPNQIQTGGKLGLPPDGISLDLTPGLMHWDGQTLNLAVTANLTERQGPDPKQGGEPKKSPQINIRQRSTEIMVRIGDTLVLAGLPSSFAKEPGMTTIFITPRLMH